MADPKPPLTKTDILDFILDLGIILGFFMCICLLIALSLRILILAAIVLRFVSKLARQVHHLCQEHIRSQFNALIMAYNDKSPKEGPEVEPQRMIMLPTRRPTLFPSILPRLPERQMCHPQRRFLTKEWTSKSSGGWVDIPARFHPFPRLPTELRLMIWELARPDPRVIKLSISKKDIVKYQNKRHSEFMYGYHSKAKVPSLLHACRESREEALKWYQLSFPSIVSSFSKPRTYFDNSRDYLYLQCAICYSQGGAPGTWHTGNCGFSQKPAENIPLRNAIYEYNSNWNPLFGICYRATGLKNLLLVTSEDGMGSRYFMPLSAFALEQKIAAWQESKSLLDLWKITRIEVRDMRNSLPSRNDPMLNKPTSALHSIDWTALPKMTLKQKILHLKYEHPPRYEPTTALDSIEWVALHKRTLKRKLPDDATMQKPRRRILPLEDEVGTFLEPAADDDEEASNAEDEEGSDGNDSDRVGGDDQEESDEDDVSGEGHD